MFIVISCSGSANPYEIEDEYHSVSREAAQSLQASGPAAEPNYAQVDQSRKKKNRIPANDEYAEVDKSKKTKKKKKVRMTKDITLNTFFIFGNVSVLIAHCFTGNV